MNAQPLKVSDQVLLRFEHLQSLFDALQHQGYRVVGPTVADGSIAYDELTSSSDLPAGWTDEQDGGLYRLTKNSDPRIFAHGLGPDSWKKFLHPAELLLWGASRAGKGFQVEPESIKAPKLAFFGVRACELNAIEIQDKVFMNGEFQDPGYCARRRKVFIIAANCTRAGGTCFCKSMNSGPEATEGFDLAMTEVTSQDQHFFVIRIGTKRGTEILSGVPTKKVSEDDLQKAAENIAKAANQMGRELDTTEIKSLFYRNYENPRWEEVAQRCLNCANCTMVCPTCFCTTVEDVTDLSGNQARRWRKWDSCFTSDFSYIHGGSVRPSRRSRYRQWLTHKLATWIDQFGTLGCVGCGRCITWCPVAIDLTEEVRAIRETESNANATPVAKEKKNGNT
jgi:sulfhydrogenase subunit beta (sulfur reductase)